MRNLFKQICTEEAKALNIFYHNSSRELEELKSKIKEAEKEQKENQEIYNSIYAEIDKVLHKDGYIGDYSDVIEYFSRIHLNFTAKNCYFDIQPELQALYYSLPIKSNVLEKLQEQYDILVMKRQRFNNITEEILINSILMAFQKLIPKQSNIMLNVSAFLGYSNSGNFPYNIDVNKDFINYYLVDWYISNIDAYLKIPLELLKYSKREVLFK